MQPHALQVAATGGIRLQVHRGLLGKDHYPVDKSTRQPIRAQDRDGESLGGKGDDGAGYDIDLGRLDGQGQEC